MSQYTNTILITGGTLGLGYEAAVALAKRHPNYQMIIASRSDSNSASASINVATGTNNTLFLPLDLSSLDNIRAFATSYSQHNFPPIKALLLNAGLQFPGPLQFSTDGFEKTFAITHLGHALLFYLLRPHLASDARIVVTASGVHDPAQKTGMPVPNFVSAEAVARPDPCTATSDGRERYTTAKLCNVLWTYALARRLTQDAAKGEKKWTVVMMDPGLMPGTGLGRDYPAAFRFLWFYVLPYAVPLLRMLVTPHVYTTKESGGNLAELATGKEGEGVSGVYFQGATRAESSVESNVEGKQEDLYEWTLKAAAKGKEQEENFRRLAG